MIYIYIRDIPAHIWRHENVE